MFTNRHGVIEIKVDYSKTDSEIDFNYCKTAATGSQGLIVQILIRNSANGCGHVSQFSPQP